MDKLQHNYFYLVYQEVIYFLISTSIIFLGYKYHLRIDRFIIFSIFSLFIFRLIYYYINEDLNIKEYLSFNAYGFFYNSLVYNYIYYAIGIYFGSLNYVIQKGYTYSDCDKQGKIYLLGFTRLYKMIKSKSRLIFYYFGIFLLIIIIMFIFGQYLLFKYINIINSYDINSTKVEQILKDYDDDIIIRILMITDADIFVLLVNIMALFFYLKGDSYIHRFLNFHFWGIFNKIYFSFILLIHPTILYVFYITETRINFNLQNCYLYSFSCGILLFTLVILHYAILELPYKKVVRLLLKRFEITQNIYYIEKNNTFNVKQMEIRGDLVNRSTSVDIVDENENGGEEEEEKDEENNYIKLDEKHSFENEDNNENEN